jgi:hypothetical protein
VTAPDAPGLRELGIDCVDEDLFAVSGSEAAILEEVAAFRAKAALTYTRRRAGPLPLGEWEIIVREATDQLLRAHLALLLATDQPGEIHSALASAGLAVRTFQPGYDALVASLAASIKKNP